MANNGTGQTPQSEDKTITIRTDGKDLDEAYDLHQKLRHETILPEEYERVLRKIDKRVLPILFLVYMLQYLDKIALNFAAAYGLEESLGLTQSEYNWLGSIFYFGYLVSQYPANYAMQKWPIAKFLGATILVWGTILITTPACKSFAGIATNRFLLGLAEAPINPGFVLIMGSFYTTREHPIRTEIYYCTVGIATMFGGLIGYSVGKIRIKTVQSWMWVFLLFGAISLISAIITLLVLPDSLTTAPFLGEEEKAIAAKRVSTHKQGVKNKYFKWAQAKECVKDPKIWILWIMTMAGQVPNAAMTSFGSLILKDFGFGAAETQYMQIPGGAIQFGSLLVAGYVCSKWKDIRCLVMGSSILICVCGAGLLVALPENQRWPRLVALWLCYFHPVGMSLALTMISSNVAGYTKKQLTSATIFVGYCIGNIIGPQTFQKSPMHGYQSAYIAMLVGYVVKFLSVAALYVYMHNSNKARDREAALLLASDASKAALKTAIELDTEAIENAMHDRTENENRGFRYSL